MPKSIAYTELRLHKGPYKTGRKPSTPPRVNSNSNGMLISPEETASMPKSLEHESDSKTTESSIASHPTSTKLCTSEKAVTGYKICSLDDSSLDQDVSLQNRLRPLIDNLVEQKKRAKNKLIRRQIKARLHQLPELPEECLTKKTFPAGLRNHWLGPSQTHNGLGRR